MAMLIVTARAVAAPTIEKVEPPNWWVPDTLNPIQVLLTGTELQDATVTTASRGFKIETRYTSDNGHYLFVYLDIDKQVTPGRYRFQVTSGAGTGQFDFELNRPLKTDGRFRGFGPDDVIYLLMPDRFAHGGHPNESLPQTTAALDQSGDRRNGGYHGGDLCGVLDHLDYLKDLGVTAIWMTPIYRNSSSNCPGAYHGYSTIDYYDVEPHFGTMADFKELVDVAHQKGMKIIQDQVANHCGPRHSWVEDPPTKTWFNNLDSVPKLRNNFDIASLADPYARPSRREVPVRGWFAGILPDLNQDDPLVSDYEIQNALWWIGMTGIDGIRQDTYPYVDRRFWEKWQTAINRQYPDFVCVSEITADTPAVLSFFEGGTRRYGTDTKLRSELDFPLEHTLRNVFGAHQQPFTRLADILASDSLFLHPEMLVVFVGNHDQPRMLTVAQGDISKLIMAQTFVLTTRRTAHMYYGDEIAMGAGPGSGDASFRSNFPGGFPGDPLNAFRPEGRTGDAATVFNWTRALLHFRQDHPALRRGEMVNLLVSQDQYAYLRSSPEEYVLILLNRAGNTNAVELSVDDLAIPEGLHFKAFPRGSSDLVVTAGKLVINEPKEIEIYSAKRP